MSYRRIYRAGLALALAACARPQVVTAPAPTSAPAPEPVRAETTIAVRPDTAPPPVVGVRPSFTSRSDSLNWVASRRLAAHSKGFRVVVSLFDRRVWVIDGSDTLRTAPGAVAAGNRLEYAGRVWNFKMPRGRRTVLRKQLEPVWRPPDWLYAETAKEYGLRLAYLPGTRPVALSDGKKLLVRNGYAGLILPGERRFEALPTEEHIVFDKTLYIPPPGSKNRLVHGELGHHALDLGEGFLLHGTPYKTSIGTASTHGCVRLRDDDVKWLYDHVPVGTNVYIY